MGKIWPYAIAFSVMCYIYAICKAFNLAWAAERPWSEVIFFLVVATVIFIIFFNRKKIVELYNKIKNKR